MHLHAAARSKQFSVATCLQNAKETREKQISLSYENQDVVLAGFGHRITEYCFHEFLLTVLSLCSERETRRETGSHVSKSLPHKSLNSRCYRAARAAGEREDVYITRRYRTMGMGHLFCSLAADHTMRVSEEIPSARSRLVVCLEAIYHT